jgi:chaperonin cofactor prefoldin
MENKGKTTQRETKTATRAAIKNACLFDPEDGWKFKISEIPNDINISDFCLGALELARAGKLVLTNDLKSLHLVYTQGERIRRERLSEGRPFVDQYGRAVKCGEIYLNSGNLLLKTSKYNIITIFSLNGFSHIKEKIFGDTKKRQLSNPLDDQKSLKRRHSPDPDSPSLSELDKSSDKADLPKFIFRAKVETVPTKSDDSLELKEKIKSQEEKIKCLENKIERLQDNIEDSKNNAREIVTELIQRTANSGMSTIHQIVQDSIEFADHLSDIQSIELSSLFLTFYRKGLEKELSVLKIHLDRNASISEAAYSKSILTRL